MNGRAEHKVAHHYFRNSTKWLFLISVFGKKPKALQIWDHTALQAESAKYGLWACLIYKYVPWNPEWALYFYIQGTRGHCFFFQQTLKAAPWARLILEMSNNTDNLNGIIEREAALGEPRCGEFFDKIIYCWHRGWSLRVPSSLGFSGRHETSPGGWRRQRNLWKKFLPSFFRCLS